MEGTRGHATAVSYASRSATISSQGFRHSLQIATAPVEAGPKPCAREHRLGELLLPRRRAQNRRAAHGPREQSRQPPARSRRTPLRSTRTLPGPGGRAVAGLPFQRQFEVPGSADAHSEPRPAGRERVAEDAACFERCLGRRSSRWSSHSSDSQALSSDPCVTVLSS